MRRSESRSSPRRQNRGVLLIVVAFLVASASVRVATGSGTAIAREVAGLAAETPTADPRPEPADQEDIATLMAELKSREAEADERDRALAARRQALDLAERKIDEQLTALEAAEESLRETMAVASRAAEDDLAQLTSVYENMKPAQAAPIFQRMAPEFAAGFLGRMRPDAAANILSGLDPESAYTISVLLASRNADVPRDIAPPSETES